MAEFNLNSSFVPQGDQPQAIDNLVKGLNENDKMEISFDNISPDTFFYDVIYSSKETDFIKKAKAMGNKTENGKMMFIYQAHQAFTIWHKLMPNIDDEVIKLIE